MRSKELKPSLIFASASAVLDSKIAEGVASSIRVHIAPEVRKTSLPRLVDTDSVVWYIQNAFRIGMTVNSLKALLTSSIPAVAEYVIANGISNEKLNFWLNMAKVYGLPSGLTQLIDKMTAPVELLDGSLVVIVPQVSRSVEVGDSKISRHKSTEWAVLPRWFEPDLSLSPDRDVHVLLNQMYKSAIGPSAVRDAKSLHYLVDPTAIDWYEDGQDIALLAGAVERSFLVTGSNLEVVDWKGYHSNLKPKDALVVQPFSRKVALVSEGAENESEIVRDWWMNCFMNS